MAEGSFGVPDSLLAAVAQFAGEAMVLVDDTGTIVWANEQNRSIGSEPADVVGRTPLDFVHPDDVERAVLSLAALDGPFPRMPNRYRLKATVDGSYRALDSCGTHFDHDGRTYYLFSFRPNPFLEAQTAVLTALASDEPIEAALGDLAHRLTDMGAGWAVGIAFHEGDERVVVGPLASELLGVSDGMQGDSLDTPWGQAIDRREPTSEFELSEMSPSVRSLAERHGFEAVTFYPVDDPLEKVPALFAVWFSAGAGFESNRSISYTLGPLPGNLVHLALDRRSERRRLVHLALHDPLTGLANRASFRDELDRAVGSAAIDASAPVAVIYLDLDDFKPINDAHGHDVGDHVLRQLASRFHSVVRPGDLVARLGGDEFAALCVDVSDAEVARGIAERISAVAVSPIVIDDDLTLTVSASVGVAFVDDPQASGGDQLLQAADASLYEVKRERKGGVRVTVLD